LNGYSSGQAVARTDLGEFDFALLFVGLTEPEGTKTDDPQDHGEAVDVQWLVSEDCQPSDRLALLVPSSAEDAF
jgi:hypothetical protein